MRRNQEGNTLGAQVSNEDMNQESHCFALPSSRKTKQNNPFSVFKNIFVIDNPKLTKKRQRTVYIPRNCLALYNRLESLEIIFTKTESVARNKRKNST